MFLVTIEVELGSNLIIEVKIYPYSNYLENAKSILELSQRAITLFKKQDPMQKRRLITMLVSNCSYKNEKLYV